VRRVAFLADPRVPGAVNRLRADRGGVMPYKQKQARAIFLSIKRKKGLKAAKRFGRKHRASFRNSAKHRKR
jgi:hypothetical protein